MTFPPLSLDRWSTQAADLRELFQEQMYGWLPPVKPLTLGEEKSLRPGLQLRKIGSLDVLHAEPSGEPRATFVGVNFSGNHTVVDDPEVPEPRGWSYPDGALWPVSRGCHKERWCVEEVTAAGFGLATFCHSDVVPDEAGLAFAELKKLNDRPLGAVAAWAWGLLSLAATIPGPVIFVGHSRMGKAALVAGAFGGDGVVSIQSGCGGSAPSRTSVGETVSQITTAFPHWFVPAFANYAGREDQLPFDQHALLALCAPKPVLLLNAEDDLWANPAGQEEMADLAQPVFASLGGTIECRRRPGGHSVIRKDWEMILDFFENFQ